MSFCGNDESTCGCVNELDVLFVGVLVMRALRLGENWALKHSPQHMGITQLENLGAIHLRLFSSA